MYKLVKLLVFGIILLVVVILAVIAYRKLNARIMASNTLLGVIGNALLLILTNILLIVAGTGCLLTVYEYLLETS